MISIRKAGLDDIPYLAELLGYLFEQEAEFTADYDRQRAGLEMIISDPTIGKILLAQNEAGKVIGMVSLLFTVSTALGSKVALLEDMIVHPDFRGKGCGSKLVGAAMELAKELDCHRITLLTDFDDLAAEKFYQKHGFKLSPMVPLRQLI
ncbi:GNAT family N-acetyltransferase [Pelagicoccus albus]|uniref:GNAT family N-acetyltransferase n=1 Tax=Pelagicoccus albus TaxID=415222 RepID=A0A7X1B9D6_9BACT|nr:GNAT family N-acetyltransferase [Pelagicoccus albus]MBC2608110.1 GNAT family N-acetyltransferase [Pelagicoccus albus]